MFYDKIKLFKDFKAIFIFLNFLRKINSRKKIRKNKKV